MRKSANKLEKWYMGQVASLGCLITGSSAQYHHINSGHHRMGHLFGLPLCPELHEGLKLSVGNTKKAFVKKYGNELWMLVNRIRPLLNERLYEIEDVVKLKRVFEIQDQRIYHGKLKYVLVPPSNVEDDENDL